MSIANKRGVNSEARGTQPGVKRSRAFGSHATPIAARGARSHVEGDGLERWSVAGTVVNARVRARRRGSRWDLVAFEPVAG